MGQEQAQAGTLEQFIGERSVNGIVVRAIPIRRMEDWLRAQGDEAKMIEIATGLSPEAVDRLDQPSAEAVLIAAEELNRDFFQRYLDRQIARKRRIEDATQRGAGNR